MRQRRGSDELGLVRPATDAPQPPESPDVQVAVAAEQLADDGAGESRDAFVARLKREHGRNYSFCQLLQEE